MLLLSVWQVNAQESKTVFGLKTGFNVSGLSATVNSEPIFKTGFHFGIYTRTSIGASWHFRPELYYSRQGQKEKPDRSTAEAKVILNYVNLPLLFETGKTVTFQFGPQIGFRASSKYQETMGNDKVDEDTKDITAGADLSLVLGLGINANENLNFGVRLNYGLTDVYKVEPDIPGVAFPEIKNRVFHLYIGYSF